MVQSRFSVKYLFIFHMIIKCGSTERYRNDLGKQRYCTHISQQSMIRDVLRAMGEKSRVVRDQKTV